MALFARWLCAFWILVVAAWASHEENIDLVGSGDSLFARIAADVQPFYDTAHDTSRTALISDLTDRTSRRLSRRHGNVGERQGVDHSAAVHQKQLPAWMSAAVGTPPTMPPTKPLDPDNLTGLAVANCTTRNVTDGFHCEQAIDGIANGTQNGWVYSGALPAEVSFHLMNSSAIVVSAVTIVSGFGRDDHHIQDVEIEFETIDHQMVSPVALRVEDAYPVNYVVENGDRVNLGGQPGQTQFRLLFNPISFVKTMTMRVFSTELAHNGTGAFVLNEVNLEGALIIPTSSPTVAPTPNPTGSPTFAPTASPTAPPTPEPTLEMIEWTADASGHSWSDNSQIQVGSTSIRGPWPCEPKVVASTFDMASAHTHLGLQMRLWGLGSCPGYSVAVKVDNIGWFKSAMPSNGSCTGSFHPYTGKPIREGLNCFQDAAIRRPNSGSTVRVSIEMQRPAVLPLTLQDGDVDPAQWTQDATLNTTNGVLHGIWQAGAEDLVKKTLKFSHHTELQIYARFWAIGDWTAEDAFMKVGGETWWDATVNTNRSCTAGGGFRYFPGYLNSSSIRDDQNELDPEALAAVEARTPDTSVKCYRDISIRKAHTARSTELEFGTSVSGANKWWAFSNVQIYTDGVNNPGSWGFSSVQLSADKAAVISDFVSDATETVHREIDQKAQALAVAKTGFTMATESHTSDKNGEVSAEAAVTQTKADIEKLKTAEEIAKAAAKDAETAKAEAEGVFDSKEQTYDSAKANVTATQGTVSDSQTEVRQLQNDPEQQARVEAEAIAKDEIERKKTWVTDETQKIQKTKDFNITMQGHVAHVDQAKQDVHSIEGNLGDENVDAAVEQVKQAIKDITADASKAATTSSSFSSLKQEGDAKVHQQELGLQQRSADIQVKEGVLKGANEKKAFDARASEQQDEAHAQKLTALRASKMARDSDEHNAGEVAHEAEVAAQDAEKQHDEDSKKLKTLKLQLQKQEEAKAAAKTSLDQAQQHESEVKADELRAGNEMKAAVAAQEAAETEVEDSKNNFQDAKSALGDAQGGEKDEIRKLGQDLDNAKDAKRLAQAAVKQKQERLAATQSILQAKTDKRTQIRDVTVAEATGVVSDSQGKVELAREVVQSNDAKYLESKNLAVEKEQELTAAHETLNKLVNALKGLQASVDSASQRLEEDKKDVEAGKANETIAQRSVDKEVTERARLAEAIKGAEAKIANSTAALVSLGVQITEAATENRTITFTVTQQEQVAKAAALGKQAATKHFSDEKGELVMSQAGVDAAGRQVRKAKSDVEDAKQVITQKQALVEDAEQSLKRSQQDKATALALVSRKSSEIRNLVVEIAAAQEQQRAAERTAQGKKADESPAEAELAKHQARLDILMGPGSTYAAAKSELEDKQKELTKAQSKLATANEMLENGKRLFAEALSAKRMAEQAASNAERKYKELGLQVVKAKYVHKTAVVKLARLYSGITGYNQDYMNWESQVAHAEDAATTSRRQADSYQAAANTERHKSAQMESQMRTDERSMTEHLTEVADARKELEAQEKELAAAYEAQKHAVRASKLGDAKQKSGLLLLDARHEASRARKAAGAVAQTALTQFKSVQKDKAEAQSNLQDDATTDLKEFAVELSKFGENTADSIKHGAHKQAETSNSASDGLVRIINATAADEIRESKASAERLLHARMMGAQAAGSKREAEVQVGCDENAPCLIQLAEEPELTEAQAAAEVTAAKEAIHNTRSEEKGAAEKYKSSQAMYETAKMKFARQQGATKSAIFEAGHMHKSSQKSDVALKKVQGHTDTAAAKLKTAKDAVSEGHAESDALKKQVDGHRAERTEQFKNIAKEENRAEEAFTAAQRASGDIEKLEQGISQAAADVNAPQRAVVEKTHIFEKEKVEVDLVKREKDGAKAQLDEAIRVTNDADAKVKQAADKTNSLDGTKQETLKAKADAAKSAASAEVRAEGAHKDIVAEKQQVVNAKGELQGDEDKMTAAEKEQELARASHKAQEVDLDDATNKLNDANGKVESAKSVLEKSEQELAQSNRKSTQLEKMASKEEQARSKHLESAKGLNQDFQSTVQEWQQEVDAHSTTVQQLQSAESQVAAAQSALNDAESSEKQGSQAKDAGDEAKHSAEQADEKAKIAETKAMSSLNNSKDKKVQADNQMAKAETKLEVAKKKLESAEESISKAQQNNAQALSALQETQLASTQADAAERHAQAAVSLKTQQGGQRLAVLVAAEKAAKKVLEESKDKENTARAANKRTTEAHRQARSLIEPTEDQSSEAKDTLDEASDAVVQTKGKISEADIAVAESHAAIELAQQASAAAKQKHDVAVAAVKAAQSAIDSETELRKKDAAAAAKLLAKASHAVEAAQDLVDTAQSERDDAQGGLDQSKVLVQSVKELGEAITTEQQKIAASSTAAKAEESGALDGQSSIGVSVEQVDTAHASGVEAHSQSEQMQHRVAQAIAEQAGAITQAESDLEVQTEKHTEIVAQIDSHDEKLGEAKVVLRTATKALGMKKIEAEQAAVEQQSAKMTFASAKAAAEDKMRAASSLLVEKAEKETELSEELNPAHEQATDRVVQSAEALEQSQIQLTAMQKEVAAARNPGTVSTNIRNIVEKMKETMIPTSFSTLDVAPTLLSNREAQ